MVGFRLMDFWKDKRILVTGGAGFLGSHVVNKLIKTRDVSRNQLVIPRSKDVDLRNWNNCLAITKNIDIVINLSARVGGIGFNQRYPGTLFFDNILMGTFLIEAARLNNVKKFVQVGTVCAYPKFTPTPFKEDNLWDGYPEETNAPYGIAKKALLVMAQAYRVQYNMNIIYLLPTNLYGPHDNFDLEQSHVIPAMIRKFVEAKEKDQSQVQLWGTGKASREFLYVEDAAKGILLATEKYDKQYPVNLGSGQEITIMQLAQIISELSGFTGQIIWDASKPDGQPRRVLDVSRANKEFGFQASTGFNEGLKKTIKWYMQDVKKKSV
jgi:GDP-L-fucose synthase